MQTDFEHDLTDALRDGFAYYKYKLPVRENIRAQLIDYLTVHKKLVFPKARLVSYVPSFLKIKNAHPKKAEIEHLEHLIIYGGDINLFQKKTISNKFSRSPRL